MKTKNLSEIDKKLEPFKKPLEEEYKNQVRSLFNLIVEKHGKGLAKAFLMGKMDPFEAETYLHVLKPHLKATMSCYRVHNAPDAELDRQKLAIKAKIRANATVEIWKAKIKGKIVSLVGVEVSHMGNFRFLLKGTSPAGEVEIEQDMKNNVSKHGKFFTQFPALIKVNGKRVSEKDYKKFLMDSCLS